MCDRTDKDEQRDKEDSSMQDIVRDGMVWHEGKVWNETGQHESVVDRSVREA